MNYKHLSVAATAALIFLSLFLVVSTNSEIKKVSTSNTVSFTGEGKVSAIPDIAIASLSIITESPSSKTAQDQNTAKSNDVIKFLKEQGVEEKDIRTTSYNIYPQYRYPQFEQPKISGYQVNQTVEIKIRNLGQVSKIMDGIVTAGANQVNNLGFIIENPDQIQAQAREKAIENAKEKAETLRKQIGIKLGRIVNFSENLGGFPQPYPVYERALGVGGGGGPALPVGENEIVINITLTYQIR